MTVVKEERSGGDPYGPSRTTLTILPELSFATVLSRPVSPFRALIRNTRSLSPLFLAISDDEVTFEIENGCDSKGSIEMSGKVRNML